MKKFLLLLLLLLSSCRTQTVVLPSSHSRDSLVTRVNTRVDSIREYVRDSMSIRMVSGTAEISGTAGPSPDTVYIDRWHTAYKDRWRVNTRVDTITLAHTDTITVPVPVDPPSRKSLALSERVRVLGKGCLIGGIGAVVLLFLLRIATRLYLRR